MTANASGGFDVSGPHTFARSGVQPVVVTVQDFTGSPELSFTNYVQVSPGAVTVTLTAPTTEVTFGRPATLTATVAPPAGTATPTGTVTFLDGTTTLGSVPLDANGTASLTVTTLSPGAHSITARYNGDANFANLTSTTATVTVNPNVTDQIAIRLGGIVRRGRRWRQAVTIRNDGADLSGPVVLALRNLNPRVVLVNASGRTQAFAPLNAPFFTFVGRNGRLASGQVVTQVLFFTSRRRSFINYTPVILAGATQV